MTKSVRQRLDKVEKDIKFIGLTLRFMSCSNDEKRKQDYKNQMEQMVKEKREAHDRY